MRIVKKLQFDELQRNSAVAATHSDRLVLPSSFPLRSERRTAPAGSTVIRAGGAGARVRTIVSGWGFRFRTLTDGRRQILDILLPGDTFGLETLFGESTDTCVQAATNMVYLALSADDLTVGFDQSPVLRRNLMRLLFGERALMEASVVRLGRYDAEERAAAFLTDLYARLNRVGLAKNNTYVLELTQLELADLLGLHLIHLNRVLVRLRARKLISINKRVVTLLDMEGLSDMVPPMTVSETPPWMLPVETHTAPPDNADG